MQKVTHEKKTLIEIENDKTVKERVLSLQRQHHV